MGFRASATALSVHCLVSADSPSLGGIPGGKLGTDGAPCVLPRSASAVQRRWSPSPRSHIFRLAAGPCPAASARSAQVPASRYVACFHLLSGSTCWVREAGLEMGDRHHLLPVPLETPGRREAGARLKTSPKRAVYSRILGSPGSGHRPEGQGSPPFLSA